MNSQVEKTERIFALDTLRAIMMLLGIVLHSAVTYASLPMPWFIKSPDHNLGFTALVDFIHLFRMPIFFVVSGFFAALLFFERSKREMILNRIKRIVLPFMAGILFLYPLVIMAGKYSFHAFKGDQLNMGALLDQVIIHVTSFGVSTIHLWFLYYLAMFCFLMWGLYKLFEKNNRVNFIFLQFQNRFSRAFHSKSIIMYLSLTTFLCLFGMGSIEIKTSSAFMPDLFTFLVYAVFFCFGWVLYGQRKHLNLFQKNDWLFIGFALTLFSVKWSLIMVLDFNLPTYLIVFMMAGQALCIWLLIFGIIGLFIRYFNKPSAWGRYISDASYWIYLVHLPLTLFIPGILYPFQIGSMGGFVVTSLATAFVCTLTYEMFVRSSPIGLFLNGRKYPRVFIKMPLLQMEK